jgi:hypothetical protein
MQSWLVTSHASQKYLSASLVKPVVLRLSPFPVASLAYKPFWITIAATTVAFPVLAFQPIYPEA